MRAEQVRTALRLGEEWDERLAALEAVGEPGSPVVVPQGGAAAAILTRLAVPAEEIPAIVAVLPVIAADPALRWLLERTAEDLRRRANTHDWVDGGPSLPGGLGAPAAWFYLAAYLANVEHVLGLHAARGIDPAITWATLADIGEKVAAHRRRTGHGGMSTQFWFTLHQRGVIFSVGRLQFNLAELDHRAVDTPAGSPAVGLHIPEWGGPLTPAAVQDSLERIRAFLAAHVPAHPAALAQCHSWLLDPQLAGRLAATSNIVAFGERFTLWPAGPEESGLGADGLTPGDRSVLEFVFRRGSRPLAELPRRTSLERAALDQLDAGGHWQQRNGWLRLP